MILRAVLASALALLALACTPATAPRAKSTRFTEPGDQRVEIPVLGGKRQAIVRLPPGFAERGPLPVLLAFHGGGGSARHFKKYAGLDAPGDANGFVLIYPDGTGAFGGRFLTWNAGDCCGYAQEHRSDDVGFVLALLADLASDLDLDRTRVYATGHSNGAMMAYRLAADAAPRIAAIVPVAGADMTTTFEPSEPVAVLHVHSVDDPRALFAGGEGPRFPLTTVRVVHRPVDDGLARWRERDGCRGSGTPGETRQAGSQRATYLDFGPCADGSGVALWKLGGIGHGWPGGRLAVSEKIMGPYTTLVQVADEIFRFVPRFTKPDAPPLGAD